MHSFVLWMLYVALILGPIHQMLIAINRWSYLMVHELKIKKTTEPQAVWTDDFMVPESSTGSFYDRTQNNRRKTLHSGADRKELVIKIWNSDSGGMLDVSQKKGCWMPARGDGVSSQLLQNQLQILTVQYSHVKFSKRCTKCNALLPSDSMINRFLRIKDLDLLIECWQYGT